MCLLWRRWTALLAVLGITSSCLAQLTVDLEYGVYRSIYNPSSRLNVWKGIRYAAPPLGQLRWQPPQEPAVDRSLVVVASAPGPICPQAMPAIPGMPFIPGNEDCLFLNVYSPIPSAGANSSSASGSGLPVLVVIHGGGYGAGDASQDMSAFIGANNNSLVAVVIQYRVGALSPSRR